jgi:hypothetical protein
LLLNLLIQLGVWMLNKREMRAGTALVAMALTTALAGCGTDSEAGAFIPGFTPTPAPAARLEALPTATAVPGA